MSKKLLTIFSLLLIFFAMSCNNKSTGPTNTTTTDPVAPLKDSQYVGKWYYEETSSNTNTLVFEIKQDGSIDLFIDATTVGASVKGTDVVKELDAKFKATFSEEGQSQEIIFTFTSSTAGSMTVSGQEGGTIPVVKK